MAKTVDSREGGIMPLSRKAVSVVLAFALATWAPGVGARAYADEPEAAADVPAEAAGEEFSDEQLLTPLGGSEPDVLGGEGVADVTGAQASGDDGEMGTIIVQLEEGAGQSPLDPFLSLFGVRTDEGRHDEMRSRIAGLVNGVVADGGIQLFSEDGSAHEGAAVTPVADYYHVIDGFAIEAPKGLVEEIKQIDGVKNAFLDETRSLLDEQAALAAGSLDLSAEEGGLERDRYVENQSSLSMTGADKVEYRGAGQVIAIIDSGVQTNHEAFSGDLDDASVAFTEAQVNAAKQSLNAGKGGKYVSEKIAFCYDYADNDAEVTPGSSIDLSHGTHVAGIAAANGGKIEGTAPDAQIMMFKVCDDFQGAIRDSTLLAAMDDIAALDAAAEAAGGHGIDAMNMSIGSDNGFGEAASSTFSDALGALEDAGIASNVAAGNSYSSARGNNSGQNLPYASDPDASVVSNPASLDSVMAVASVNDAKGSACFFYGEGHVEYQQLSAQDGSETAQFSGIANGDYPVVDGGIGSSADASKVSEDNDGSLAGKMVLVQRGGEENGEPLTFQKKAENFISMGPVAVVIYDNVASTSTNFGLSKGLSVPVVGISLENGQKMVDDLGAGKTVKITVEQGALSPDASFGNYSMSDFSSWGTTPEMWIKPEIAAPGGNIYSSVTGGSAAYDYMSGTSMATPQMAGISAQMMQYVSTDAKFSGMSQAARRALVTELLMSTARPIDELGDGASYYPVRQQGAGIADVPAAMSTPVYATVDGARDADRPKAELGESGQGSWSFTVRLHNLTGEEVTYAPEAHAVSDQVAGGLFQQNTKDWTGQGISVAFGGSGYDAAADTVTVPANGEATYTVTVTCEGAFKDWAAANTPNGTFVEGFAMLNGQGEGAVDLSVPFLGFYGDWDAVPAFDGDLAGTDSVHMAGSYVANGNTGNPLGINPFDAMADYADQKSLIHPEKYVVSNTTWSSSPSSLYPLTGLMRSVKEYKAEYKNAAGTVVRSYTQDYLRKTYYNSSYGIVYAEQMGSEAPIFNGKDDNGNRVADGTYTLSRTVTTAGGDNGTQTLGDVAFSFDTSKPKITDVVYSGEGDERAVSFKVTDSSWLAAVQFNDPETGGYFYRRVADDANGDGSAQVSEAGEEQFVENGDGTKTWSFTVKLSDLREMWDSYETGLPIANAVNLYAWDYGLNGSDPAKVVVTPVAPTGLSVSPAEMTLYAGQEGQLSAAIEPADATETDVTWTTSDSEVATVSGTGVVHAVKNGTVTVTAALDYDPSITATTTIEVTDVPEDEGIAMMSPEVLLAHEAEADVKAVVAPAYADDAVTWRSSDASIVTVVSSDGATAHVKAGTRTGDAELTAEVTHGGTTYSASMKVKVRSDDYGDFIIDEDYAEGPRLLYYAGYQTDVTLPDNVRVIGPQAFAGCSPTTVTVPAGVEKIEYQAFTQMENLTNVFFEDTDENPSHLREIGDEVFYYDLKISEMTFPRSLVKMGTGTFVSSSIEKVVLPEGLRYIPDKTFYYCTLNDVTISDRVTRIGNSAFASNSLSEIKLVGTAQGPDADGNLPTGLPSSLVTIGDYGLSGFGAQEIVLPEGVTSIGTGALASTAATKVVLNDGLESIGANALQGSRASELVIPDSVTHVGYAAFSMMSNCKTFTIGRNIADGDLDVAFPGCTACTEFIVPDDAANYRAIDGVIFNKDATTLISINEGAQERDGAYAVPAGVSRLADYSFYETKLSQVDMPESLRSIGDNAFTSSGLTSLVLPAEFERIDGRSFHTCAKLRSVDLGGTRYIGGYSFYACVSLSDLDMRSDLNRLTEIRDGAFTECSSIQEFIFPDSLTTIAGMSMANMPGLKKVHIGAGLTSSLSGAFTGDQSLASITVSADNPVYHAKDNVLYGVMSEDRDPDYPGKHLFLSLPTNTFSEYAVEEGTVMIDAQAFRNNHSLRKVTLPEGLRKLDVGSFNSCENLSDINFPDSLEYVDGLYGTDSLKIADFGTKIKEIKENAFMGSTPEHIIVRGGQNGSFDDGMVFTEDDKSAETAYFGPGMTSIKFHWNPTPATLVVPADAETLELNSPSAADIGNFTVYVPSGSAGEEAVKKALKASNISESHIRDYHDLGGTLAIGEPSGDDDPDEDVPVKTYSIGASWYQTGTDDASSVSTYLGNSVTAAYAGNGNYRVMFTPNSIYASMIQEMSYNGQVMSRDGSSYEVVLTEAELSQRLAIGFKVNTGVMVMSNSADVAFDQVAVRNMIADIAALTSGNSASDFELLAGTGEQSPVVAGGIVNVDKETRVHVQAQGGVSGGREYRFTETSPDGVQTVVQDWGSERAYSWTPVKSGATLTAEVRDATKLTVQAAGVLRAQTVKGKQALADLEALIEQAAAIDGEGRTDDALAVLQEAVEVARGTAGNDNATAAELTQAVTDLQEAVDAYFASPAVTKVEGSWFKQGTFGTDQQEASMVGRMLEGAVRVSGPNADGDYALDLDMTPAAAGLMKGVSCGGVEAVKVDGDTYRIMVGRGALSEPIEVSFTYQAGPAVMTHAADLVLAAEGVAVAKVAVTDVPVSWFKSGSDDLSEAAGFMKATAQVRKVGESYLVDFTTTAPEWLTGMRLGGVEAAQVGSGVFRLSMTEQQLQARTAVDLFVVPMGNAWVSADVAFEAGKVSEAAGSARVDEVMEAIVALPAADAVTAADGDVVRAAQEAFAVLSDAEKQQLPGVYAEKLNVAGAAYANVLISSLGDDVNLEQVAGARAAYDALSDEAAGMVSSVSYRKLLAAEKTVADAKEAAAKVRADIDKAVKSLLTADVSAAKKSLAALSPLARSLVGDAYEKKLNAASGKTVLKGATFTASGQTYRVTAAPTAKGGGTVVLTKSANAKSVTVPASVKLRDGRSYAVTSVARGAFKGAKVRTVTIGASVSKLATGAFSSSKATTVVLKTSKLSKAASVAGCFKGSKVATVRVKVGSAAANKKALATCKKVFTKKNTGTSAKTLAVK